MKLPASFRPPQHYQSSYRETFKEFPASSFGLLSNLLALDPSYRGTAKLALQNEVGKTRSSLRLFFPPVYVEETQWKQWMFFCGCSSLGQVLWHVTLKIYLHCRRRNLGHPNWKMQKSNWFVLVKITVFCFRIVKFDFCESWHRFKALKVKELCRPKLEEKEKNMVMADAKIKSKSFKEVRFQVLLRFLYETQVIKKWWTYPIVLVYPIIPKQIMH